MDAPYRPTEQGIRLTTYRPFIDGLRAVSILAVVLYHIGVPGMSGGYVGVDVFFVISGFLIISQIVEGLQRGTFSFGEFWSRRALRILPPYMVVMLFSIAAAPFVLLMPDQLHEFGKEVGHAAVMVVNHLFLIQEGYFDTAADGKVLLHFWSLAVEEQFYLVAPLLLALLWWLPSRLGYADLRPRLLFWTTAAIFVLSLAGCILFTSGGRNYAFYLSPLRAWEFVAGGAIGFLLPTARRLSGGTNAALATAGLAAILISAAVFTVDTPYPSWRAAVPVFGAAAVILGGLAWPKSAAIRLLSTPPMVWIGLVSYAWYLWHWPLLAFARILNFGERNFAIDAALALVSLGLAAATFYLVERPIRRWRERRGKRLGWAPVLAGAAACAAIAIGGLLSFDAASRRVAATTPAQYVPERGPPAPSCDLRSATATQCLAKAAGRPIGLVMGDSHALAALNGFATVAEQSGTFAAASASAGCAPLLGAKILIADTAMAADCETLRANALPLLARGEIKPAYAILFARWPIYGTDDHDYRLAVTDAGEPAPDQDAAFVAGLRHTIAGLRSFGVQRILVLGPTPFFPRHAPNCLYLADRYGMDRAQTCGATRAAAEAERSRAVSRIEAAIAGAADVRYLDPFADLCDAQRCLPYAERTILFTDTNHLSDAGITRVIAGHRAAFDWLVGAR